MWAKTAPLLTHWMASASRWPSAESMDSFSRASFSKIPATSGACRCLVASHHISEARRCLADWPHGEPLVQRHHEPLWVLGVHGHGVVCAAGPAWPGREAGLSQDRGSQRPLTCCFTANIPSSRICSLMACCSSFPVAEAQADILRVCSGLLFHVSGFKMVKVGKIGCGMWCWICMAWMSGWCQGKGSQTSRTGCFPAKVPSAGSFP